MGLCAKERSKGFETVAKFKDKKALMSDTDQKLAKNPLRLLALTPCTRIAGGLRKAVFPLVQSLSSERWMSGLSRTPGKRVWV